MGHQWYLGSSFRGLRNQKGLGIFFQSLLHGKTSVISLIAFVNWIPTSSKRNLFLICSKYRNPLPSRLKSFTLRFKDSIRPLKSRLLYIPNMSIKPGPKKL